MSCGGRGSKIAQKKRHMIFECCLTSEQACHVMNTIIKLVWMKFFYPHFVYKLFEMDDLMIRAQTERFEGLSTK